MSPQTAENSTSGIEVSTAILRQMFSYLDSLHIDKEDLLRSLGVDPAIIASPDAYIPIETYLLIEDGAAEYISDPYFGLHMGEFAEAGSWSILGYMMMNCQNLVQAFEKSTRYHRIIGNLIGGKTSLQADKIKVTLTTPPQAPIMSRHCFESTIASTFRLIRTLTGKEINPVKVQFTSPQPESTAEYERVFACPVLFGQKENAFFMHFSVIFTPILYANPGLLNYFEDYAQRFLAEMEGQSEVANKVIKILLASLDDEDLSIKKVAREMSVSVRTLQNHLKAEGVVFSDLLQEVREKLAKKYLQENYSVEEITYLLGFSEPSVFRKAFKKWAGITPAQYRQTPFSHAGQA